MAEEAAEEEENDGKHVKQIGNKIFFYSDVNLGSVQKLFECMQEANRAALQAEPCGISLHINSHGGDAYAGIAAYHHILRNPLPVTTYVDSLVASAATFLLLAGSNRIAMKHSFVLIHQVSTGFFGKYHDMIDEMANTHDLMAAFHTLYTDRTSMSTERLEELLRSERASDAATCLKDGIVHSIC